MNVRAKRAFALKALAVAVRAVGGRPHGGGGGPSPIACTYAFNSTDGMVTGFGYAGAVTMAGQTGSLTTVGGLASQVQRLSTSGASQVVNFAAGKKVIEVRFTSSHASLSSGVNGAAIAVKLLNSATLTVVAGCTLAITPAGLSVIIVRAGSAADYSEPVTGLSAVVGLEFDSTSGTVRAIIGGVVVDLITGVYTPSTCLLAIESSEGAGVQAGVTLSAEVRTGGADIAQTYAVGATEICGNPLVP